VKIGSKILAIMGVPVVFLGVSSLAMLDAGEQTAASLEEERKASAVAVAFQQVERDLVDAENATRGYLITGDRAHLDRYADAVARLPGDIAGLITLAGADVLSSTEAQKLRELANQRLSILQSLQLLAPIDDTTNHDQLKMLTSSEASVTDRFEVLIDREEADAASQLEAGQGSLDAARRTWFLIGIAGMPLGMLVSLVVVALYTQRFGRRIARTESVAHLLDEGMPLGEPSSSNDELGKLERVLIRSGTRVVELQGELRRMGTSDALTRLMNRRGFIPSAEHQLDVAKRTHQPMALVFLDLDRLKTVNDTLGHAAGDGMITEAAYVMGQTFRASDLIGRVGGDEFCVLFMTESEDTGRVALARLQEMVDETNDQDGRPFILSFSAGLAMFDPEQPSTLDEMMAIADERMYENKRAKTERLGSQEWVAMPVGRAAGPTGIGEPRHMARGFTPIEIQGKPQLDETSMLMNRRHDENEILATVELTNRPKEEWIAALNPGDATIEFQVENSTVFILCGQGGLQEHFDELKIRVRRANETYAADVWPTEATKFQERDRQFQEREDHLGRAQDEAEAIE
jgi:diguanylate cyclase (GGDEF)-like protein